MEGLLPSYVEFLWFGTTLLYIFKLFLTFRTNIWPHVREACQLSLEEGGLIVNLQVFFKKKSIVTCWTGAWRRRYSSPSCCFCVFLGYWIWFISLILEASEVSG